MTALLATQIKALQDDTGATMMDCKRALQATCGDYEAARKALLDRDDDAAQPEPVE